MNLFEQIIGHDRIKLFFRNAARKKRLFSTYLFSGPEGIGKKKTAIAIAAMLNCQAPENAPCGDCPACLKIREGNHVDVTLIEAEKDEILAEQVESILDAVRFAPFEGKARVFIIDNAHQLNPTSGNMLLKTLEEPGKGNYFFLVTSKPDSLLPTIRSRCQTVNFSAAGILDSLKNTPDFDDSYYPWLKSGGGFVETPSQLAAFTEIRHLALRFIREIAHSQPGSSLSLEDDLAEVLGNESKEKSRLFLFQVETLLRDILAIFSGNKRAIINRDMGVDLEQLAQSMDPDTIFEINSLVKRGASGLSYGIKIQNLVTVLLAEGKKVAK